MPAYFVIMSLVNIILCAYNATAYVHKGRHSANFFAGIVCGLGSILLMLMGVAA